MFLVVFGHLIEIHRDEYYELFNFIYSFHMPLFIFISGYLAKRMKVSKIINLILLYLIFQTLFNWVLHLTGDYSHLQFTYGEPHFHLWYIVSLGFWYGMAFLINKFHLTSGQKWSVYLALFAVAFMSRWYMENIESFVQIFYDNFSSRTLSLQRTLTFMPFFFLGFFMNQQTLQKAYNNLKKPKVKVSLFLVTVFLGFLFFQEVNQDHFKSILKGASQSDTYNEEAGFFIYAVKTTIHYSLAFWLCFLTLNVLSNKPNVLSRWGDRSLSIFLFHPICVFILRQKEFMDEWEPDTQLAFYLFLTIIVTYILSSSSFIKYTKYMCQPYNTLDTVFQKRNLNKYIK